ncbi:MAG: HAMP domain-containing protein [Desulfuromonadales bacterium]|nr:HAMP domain-containing protein [Desulfuromonadales bacterium]
MVFAGSPGYAATDSPPGTTHEAPPAPQQPGTERVVLPRRIPPRVAFEACEGKREGDPCSFKSSQEMLDGECRGGIENKFACRPYRNSTHAGTAQETPPEQKTGAMERAVTADPKVPGMTKPEQDTQHPAPSNNSSDNLPNQAASMPPQPHVIAPTPPMPLSIVSDKMGEYAGIFWTCLAVALFFTGTTWYGFYRYYILPLHRLSKVTQQLASGNLSARVGEGLVQRKNEVAELGRDVDRMAERIESLVGAHQRLIRDVSHELRSPLARLNVALELARQSAGPALGAPFDRIERESNRLNELIGQLLTLTKLESDGGMSQRAEIDIAELISEIAQDVDFEAKNCDRGVVVSSCETLKLIGNRELLLQALENLVRNAVRYTASGTVVELSLRKKESGGRSWAHIEVRDQGPGVPESELFDIFRPFYRVNDARERQSGGAGVGLAISDRAVRLHGGSLRAFNAPGGGLIMEMELPVA